MAFSALITAATNSANEFELYLQASMLYLILNTAVFSVSASFMYFFINFLFYGTMGNPNFVNNLNV